MTLVNPSILRYVLKRYSILNLALTETPLKVIILHIGFPLTPPEITCTAGVDGDVCWGDSIYHSSSSTLQVAPASRRACNSHWTSWMASSFILILICCDRPLYCLWETGRKVGGRSITHLPHPSHKPRARFRILIEEKLLRVLEILGLVEIILLELHRAQ